MAKRKAAGTRSRKAAAARGSAGRSRGGSKKKKKAAPARRTGGGARAAGGGTGKNARGSRKKAARKRTAATSARKPSTTARSPKRAAAKTASRRSAPRASSTAAARRTGKTGAARSGKTGAARRTAKSPATVPLRKSPALGRERRVVRDDDDLVQSTPPSSLDLDRSASAVRSGRRTMRDRFEEHTETSPALTGGDVDADWESAYSVGDEAPGGDNPTPDQDIVDDIGRAVGIEYQDNEELKGARKLEQRDKHRWELDPASSEDWEER